MSQQRAGRYYLASVCPTNDALARHQRVVFRGRDEIRYTEVRRRLPEIRRAAVQVARATYKSTRALKNPPRAWPESVRSDVEDMSDDYADFAYWFRRAGSADSAREWGRHFTKAARAINRGARFASRIRAGLDLPAQGRGC